MSDCLFCKVADGSLASEIVYEDDQIVVFKDIYPKADVHLLMIPR
jgi:histidine triad (HIT) family protein